MWQMVAGMGSRNSVVVVDKEARQAGWKEQGATSKVEIPDLPLVDSRKGPFASARTYRGAMEGCLAILKSPVG